MERRSLKYFQPTAPAMLLVLHHQSLLLNRQIAHEALELLFKKHTVFFSCGPFVLKTLLQRIERHNGPASQWLKSIKAIELDWLTFPNLSCYPPGREPGREPGSDAGYWEPEDQVEVDVDYLGSAPENRHYDEYDHEGYHYDDDFYDPSDLSLYPFFPSPPAAQPQVSSADDPYGLANHNPYRAPSPDIDRHASAQDMATKLDLLVSLELTPLFDYFDSPTFHIASITLPLYFISKQSRRDRSLTRPGHTLPLQARYWVHVCIHALHLLAFSTKEPSLQQVCVKYLPWDIWASVDPADDLARMADQGVWFDRPQDGVGSDREGEGAAFRAVWAGMLAKVPDGGQAPRQRMGLEASSKFLPWDGNVDHGSVGDELEVIFTRPAPLLSSSSVSKSG